MSRVYGERLGIVITNLETKDFFRSAQKWSLRPIGQIFGWLLADEWWSLTAIGQIEARSVTEVEVENLKTIGKIL